MIGKEQLNLLAYADDIVLIGKNGAEIENIARNLGLHVNQGKTKYMIVEQKNSLKQNKIGPFIHSIGTCKMRQFLAVLRSFFHSSLLCTFSCHPSLPTTLPSSLTSSCHLFLGLPLSVVVSKLTYNILLGILFSSILGTWPNEPNQLNLKNSVIVVA